MAQPMGPVEQLVWHVVVWAWGGVWAADRAGPKALSPQQPLDQATASWLTSLLCLPHGCLVGFSSSSLSMGLFSVEVTPFRKLLLGWKSLGPSGLVSSGTKAQVE